MRKLVYIENKSNEAEPSRIGFATFSRTNQTVYHGGRSFHRVRGFDYNHVCDQTGEEFWISGPKKNRRDALFGSKKPIVDADAKASYEALLADR